MNRFTKTLLSAALGSLALASNASAVVYSDATISFSKTTFTEGEPVTVTLTSTRGTFQPGANVVVYSDNSSFRAGGEYSNFALPAGGTTASFNIVIDDNIVNPLKSTAITLKYRSSDSGLYISPGATSVNVIDNDDTASAPAPAPSTPAPSTPSNPTTPPTTVTPPSDSTPVDGLDWPSFGDSARVSSNKFSVSLYNPYSIDGVVIITRGGRVIGKKFVPASYTKTTRKIKVTIGKSNVRRIVSRGGKVTAYFYFYGDDGELYYSAQRYKF
jgi:hypothetical protein